MKTILLETKKPEGYKILVTNIPDCVGRLSYFKIVNGVLSKHLNTDFDVAHVHWVLNPTIFESSFLHTIANCFSSRVYCSKDITLTVEYKDILKYL